MGSIAYENIMIAFISTEIEISVPPLGAHPELALILR